MICSHDGDNEFFDIVTGVLQGHSLESYVYNQPRLPTTNVNISHERKLFHTHKKRSR